MKTINILLLSLLLFSCTSGTKQSEVEIVELKLTKLEELFGEQYEKIINGIDKFKKNPNAILNALQINYFLSLVKPLKPHDDNINQSMKSIFEANELYLAIQFSDFIDKNYKGNKNKVLNIFESYLKAVCECNYSDYSSVVIDRYADIYRKGRITSTSNIAHYLEKIDTEGKYEDVIEGNNKFNSLYYPFLSLKDGIEFSNLNNNHEFIKSRILKENINIEENILSLLPQNALVAGYDQGISRLLIYLSKTQAI